MNNELDLSTINITERRLVWITTKEGSRELLTLNQLFHRIVYQAHIAGAESTKGIGLNLSKEERAEQYCRDKGLRP